MTTRNDVSTPDHRPLADNELDVVNGGSMISNAIDGVIKATASAAAGGGGEGTPLVWVGCAWVPQWW
jgi:hypothetical protein